MNRHQRRASKKNPSAPTAGSNLEPGNLDPMSIDLGPLPVAGDTPETGVFSGLSLGTVDRDSLYTSPAATTAPVKTGFMVRLIAKVLFSGWVMRRIKNPAIESLLASVAAQLGRDDIADELMRRQVSRSQFPQ